MYSIKFKKLLGHYFFPNIFLCLSLSTILVVPFCICCILLCSKSLWGSLQFFVIIYFLFYDLSYQFTDSLLCWLEYAIWAFLVFSLFYWYFLSLLLYFPIVLYTWVFFNSLKAFKMMTWNICLISAKSGLPNGQHLLTSFVPCICTFSHFSAWLTFCCCWKIDILNKIMQSSGK